MNECFPDGVPPPSLAPFPSFKNVILYFALWRPIEESRSLDVYEKRVLLSFLSIVVVVVGVVFAF